MKTMCCEMAICAIWHDCVKISADPEKATKSDALRAIALWGKLFRLVTGVTKRSAWGASEYCALQGVDF